MANYTGIEMHIDYAALVGGVTIGAGLAVWFSRLFFETSTLKPPASHRSFLRVTPRVRGFPIAMFFNYFGE